MPNIPMENCCGCTACENICPTGAIRMRADQEGFMYPEINNELCCDCRKCEKACPIITPPKLSTKIEACFVAQSEEQNVLDESTSGGFVDALCKYLLQEKGGYVCGVAFDSDFMPHHKIVDSYESARAFRNSKYAQSNMGHVFSDMLQLLRNGQKVMFIGTPCQVAGLKAYLDKDYECLITVDLVCRSIPSPVLWREYLDWQEKRHGAKVVKATCRKKTYGYHSGALELEFENGKRYAGSNRVDYFMKSFHKNICSRYSCYDCQFKTKNRCSDFTVFDSWNPSAAVKTDFTDNDKGFSGVIVHTAKGKKIISHLDNLLIYDADVDVLIGNKGGMVLNSINKPTERDAFYINKNKYGFYKTVKRFCKVSIVDRMIEAVKPIRYSVKKMGKK